MQRYREIFDDYCIPPAKARDPWLNTPSSYAPTSATLSRVEEVGPTKRVFFFDSLDGILFNMAFELTLTSGGEWKISNRFRVNRRGELTPESI